MSKSSLHRAYDRLTPEERFRLDVLATARGDLEESERLTRTCQRETYTMNHRGYTGRWSGTYEITLRMYVAIGGELAKLQMVDAFRELVPYSQTLSHEMIFEGYFRGHESGSRYAWGRAGKDGEPPGYEEDIEESEENADPATEADMDGLEATACEYLGFVPEVLDRLERSLASDALSLWKSFCAFCEECVGVGAEKIVAAVVLEPVAGRIEDLKARAERLGLEADPETVEEIRESLAQSWRVVEERGV
jgi:hypothetical protein